MTKHHSLAAERVMNTINPTEGVYVHVTVFYLILSF